MSGMVTTRERETMWKRAHPKKNAVSPRQPRCVRAVHRCIVTQHMPDTLTPFPNIFVHQSPAPLKSKKPEKRKRSNGML